LSLSEAEKARILRALEEDRGFRLAVMGLLGFQELLERFARLEERQQRLEERFAQLEERFAELEERFAKLEERQQRLEEEFKKLEERFARIEERQQRLEERFLKLEERITRLEERFLELEERVAGLEERVDKQGEILDMLVEEVKKLKASVGALGRRFGGKGFEALVREAYSDLLKHIGVEEYEVKKFRYVDVDGRYFAPGTTIEVDIVLRDGALWLIEVKSYVEEKDVAWFHAVTQAVEKIMGRRADRRIILGVIVEREAYRYASSLGIEVVYTTLAED